MSETLGERLGTCNPEGENHRYLHTEQEVVDLLVRACEAALAKINDHEPGSVTMELLEAAVSTAERHRSEPRFTLEEILRLAEVAIYMTAVDRGHGPEPPMVTAEIEQFNGNLRKCLQESRR